MFQALFDRGGASTSRPIVLPARADVPVRGTRNDAQGARRFRRPKDVIKGGLPKGLPLGARKWESDKPVFTSTFGGGTTFALAIISEAAKHLYATKAASYQPHNQKTCAHFGRNGLRFDDLFRMPAQTLFGQPRLHRLRLRAPSPAAKSIPAWSWGRFRHRKGRTFDETRVSPKVTAPNHGVLWV